MSDWRDEFIKEGLTFSDVSLRPQYSKLETRAEKEGGPSTAVCLTPQIKLAIPIISANMDTVTESKMAIAMARYGGMGVIHRNCSVERQVQEVKRVKMAEEVFIHEPYTLYPADTVYRAREIMAEHQIDSVLIIEPGIGKFFFGLITKYEIAKADGSEMIGKYAKLRDQLIVVDIENYISGNSAKEMAERIFKEQPLLGKLPFVNRNGELIGLITKKDLYRYAEYPDATRDEKDRLRVGAAIGVEENVVRPMGRVEQLIIAGVDLIVLDVAHAHAKRPMEVAKTILDLFPHIDLIVGNVATAEAVRDYAEIGIKTIKVGIGPGATCSTRIVAGAGIPQVSAILECAKEAEKHGVYIIADGGIRYPRDIAIAIGCGASTVMIGTLFAGTDESPGDIIGGMKIVRGMSSLDVNLEVKGEKFLKNHLKDMIQPEGITRKVPYVGPLFRILGALVSGLRSGMTYAGTQTIEDLQMPFERKFTRVSQAAWEESKPHDVEII